MTLLDIADYSSISLVSYSSHVATGSTAALHQLAVVRKTPGPMQRQCRVKRLGVFLSELGGAQPETSGLRRAPKISAKVVKDSSLHCWGFK